MTTTTVVQSPVITKARPSSLPFTLSSIRSQLPAECFKINTYLAIAYFLRDYFFIFVCYYFQPFVFSFGPIAIFLWMNVVGFLMWCLFVIGHDCGHGTFSENSSVNFIFGLLSHSPLLVPFSGWQKSHFLHHSYHNHVDHDHTWKPVNFSLYKEFLEAKSVSLSGKIEYFLRFSYGIFILYPVYLLNESSPLSSGNHFNPFSRLFETTHERIKASISTLCIIIFLSMVFFFSPSYTFILFGYFIPYLIFCAWLDIVTYLHHTSTSSIYYRSNEWSFLKGGLSTIDRSYGYILDHLHHHIGTHIVHHLFFTSIPHYNLNIANEKLKTILGPEFYKYDDTPFYIAMFRMMDQCKYVDDEGQCVKYKNDEDFERESKNLKEK